VRVSSSRHLAKRERHPPKMADIGKLAEWLRGYDGVVDMDFEGESPTRLRVEFATEVRADQFIWTASSLRRSTRAAGKVRRIPIETGKRYERPSRSLLAESAHAPFFQVVHARPIGRRVMIEPGVVQQLVIQSRCQAIALLCESSGREVYLAAGNRTESAVAIK
jgi:hypothetical protein